MAVDDTGRSYDLVFSGAGGDRWFSGNFDMWPLPPGTQPIALASAAWLDVGNEENSIRIDLTEPLPAVPVTTSASTPGDGERLLRVRAEVLLSNSRLYPAGGLPALAALIPALRALGALPDSSVLPGQIVALCEKYRVPVDGIPDPPAALPARWASVLRDRDRDHAAGTSEQASETGGGDEEATGACMHVAIPALDGTAITLSGLITSGHRTRLHGVFAGFPAEEYTDGPSIWLRDDTGRWHVAIAGTWSDGGVIEFAADVLPPITPPAASVDILIIGRAAQARATVPLTWRTS
jgi:hypothetical protein